MRKPALAIGVAMGMAVASTPALAEDSLFVVENASDAIIYTACGPVASVTPGQESGIVVCEWGTLHLMGDFQDGTGESRVARTHSCPTPENPVHRVRVTEGSYSPSVTVDGTSMQVPILEFRSSCEAAPW